MNAPGRLAAGRLLVCLTILLMLVGCEGAAERKAHHMALGQRYLAQQNYEKARIEFRNALQITPNDIEARYLSALASERLGNLREAVGGYQAVLNVKQDHLPTLARLGRLVLVYAGPDAALVFVKPGIEKHPDDPGLLSLRAGARSALNDAEHALPDAQRAYQLAPGDEDIAAVLVGVLRRLNQDEDARRVLESVTQRAPTAIGLRLILVEEYEKLKQGEKAEQTLKDLVQLRPGDGGLRVQLARHYAQANRLDDAEHVLRDGVRAIPDDTSLKLALTGFVRERRGLESATHELSAMVRANPRDALLQTALGELYEEAKQPAKAAAEYVAVIERNPKGAQVLPAKDRLAALKLQQGDVAGGERLIREVLEVNPRDNQSLVMRAGLELSRGTPTPAITDLRSVLRDQPDSVPTLRALSSAYMADSEPALAEDLLRPAAQAHASDLTLQLDFARVLDARGKLDEARQVMEALVRAQPTNLEFLQSAARYALAARDLPAATKYIEQIRQTYPQHPLSYYFSGLLADANGDTRAAVSDYQQAMSLAPRSSEPLEALTRLYARRGDAEAALQLLQKVAAAQPDNALPLILAGEIQLAQKKWSDAAVLFTAAIKVAPGWLAAYRGLAEARLGQGDGEAAAKILKSAAARVRPAAALHLALANLYWRLGRYGEAIDEYEAVLKEYPRSDTAKNDLALLLANTRSDQRSLDQALALAAQYADSDNPAYVDTLGWVRYSRGETEQALPLLTRAVSLAPDDPTMRYHLGMAQLRAGQKAEALQNLERSLRSSTASFDGINIARATLVSLKAPPQAGLH